jgi:hypothetical protein
MENIKCIRVLVLFCLSFAFYTILPVEFVSQSQSASPKLEGTVWEWKDAVNGTLVQTTCEFRQQGKVRCTIIASDMTMGNTVAPIIPPFPTATAHPTITQIAPLVTRVYEGTYSQKGKEVHLEFPGTGDERINATVDNTYMSGENVDTHEKWILKKVSGANNNSSGGNSSVKRKPSSIEFKDTKEVPLERIYKPEGRNSINYSKLYEIENSMRLDILNGFDKLAVGGSVIVRPKGGYQWVNPSDSEDIRVKLLPGLKEVSAERIYKMNKSSIAELVKFGESAERMHLDIIPSSHELTIVRPAKGYRWLNHNDPKDIKVERIP